MKPTHFSLSIPEPCSENWEEMSLCGEGRFCGSCQKTVIDFTGYSDAALAAFFVGKDTQNVCGRFYTSQIENKIFSYTAPAKKPYRTLAMAASIAALTVVSFVAEAQQEKLLNKVPAINFQSDLAQTKELPAALSTQDSLAIEGVIKDKKGELIMNACVQLFSGSEMIAATYSDLDGNYRLVILRSQKQTGQPSIKCRAYGYNDIDTVFPWPTESILSDVVLLMEATANKTECSITIRVGGIRAEPKMISQDPGSGTIIPASRLEKMPR